MIDVSIIIVNYNTKELVKQCITSIAANVKDVTYEIIVTDNASKDGSVEMLKNDLPFVKVIKSETNGGFAYANNLAVKESKGRFIFLLNSDTIILKDAITKMIKYMDKEVWIGMLGPKLLNEDLSHQTSISGFPTVMREFFHIYKFKNLLQIPFIKKLIVKISGNLGSKDIEQYFKNYKEIEEPEVVQVLVGAALLIRRKVIDDIGGLDERFFMYYEEIDFCYRAFRSGWKCVYFPYSEIIHLIGQSGERISGKINEFTFYERYKSMIKYFRKNNGIVKEFLIRLNLIIGLSLRIFLTSIKQIFSPSKLYLHNCKIYFNTIKIAFGVENRD